MAVPLIDHFRADPRTSLILVSGTAVFALALNLYGLLIGITVVTSHLLYLPIILASFYYPRRGIWFGGGISAIYFMMVVATRSGFPEDLGSAAARCGMFIVIAFVVSYLSLRLKENEQNLIFAKEEWERTFDAVPDLIALIDQNQKILRVNRALAAKLCITPEQAVGLHCYEVMHCTDAPPDICPHIKLIRDGNEHTSEVHEDRLGGDFLVTVSPLRNANGIMIGSVHVARDITERKRAVESLRQSEEKFRTLMENLNVGVYRNTADSEGRFLWANTAQAHMLGYDSVEELLQVPVMDLYPNPEERKKFLSDLNACGIYKGRVLQLKKKDGTLIWVSVNARPKCNENGEVEWVDGVIEDITERRALQQEMAYHNRELERINEALAHANKKLNILSSVTRHDILNKITALLAYLELSQELTRDPALLEYMHKEIDTVLSIERQIEFTKYYEDIGVRSPEWQDLPSTIRRAAVQLPLKEVALNVHLDGISIFSDPLIEKVFYNLMENSVRHGDRVTAISLFSQESPGGLTIVYEDNGTGIPSENKEKIFIRGFGKHTGLGLFLIREILSITGITIAETGEYGKGARFEINVPKDRYRQSVSPADEQ
ncbi:MAG: PAS domain-containing sensor histidine kinase [Methanoregula sp.]|nr:MAG: PAS domain-containing sensor histidine kinase [Methanoregula sp.]